MDLSFARLSGSGATAVTALPTELAVLLASAVGRQGASTTARAQARLGSGARATGLLRPADGRFNAAVATLLASPSGAPAEHAGAFAAEVKQPFT